ncbi:hypothetical protein BV22DRAFT_470471 [Leucogyrophana mollusca]|uniref:Uncharacterized protein n=1 Tax=Leucogyrophana mollusca TaxID=85980 RepID=A0ACB8BID3_9AGAM|nr:hypothetical protein BV22DRAFT_470471 [Leucogyrophana mollusca]
MKRSPHASNVAGYSRQTRMSSPRHSKSSSCIKVRWHRRVKHAPLTLRPYTVITMGYVDSDDPILLQRLQIVMYCRLAPVALWVFEYFLTLDDEIRFMWSKRHWNQVHVLFVITRYLPIMAMVCLIYETLPSYLAMETCWQMYQIGGWTSVLIMVATEALLLLRTLALWHENRTLKAALITSYAIAFIVIISCFAVNYSSGVGSICTFRSTEYHTEDEYQLVTGPYWGVASFELAVICLTIYHGYQSRICLGEYSGGRVMNALRQGNLIYACCLFAMSIGNIVLYFHLPSDGWSGLLFVFQCVLHGAMGSRITFELRRRDAGGDETTDSISFPDMRFALMPMRSYRELTLEN